MIRHKLYEEARRAIEVHRWLESEKHGFDLGPEAEQDWVRLYWHGFFRARFVEHLRGLVYYEELGADCFALGGTPLSVERKLLDTVLDKIRQGAENLDLLGWAVRERLPRDPILTILKVVDMNRRRLPPPIDEARSQPA